MSERKHVVLYTDGSSLGNPGPGGYGVVLLYGTHRREISGGFRRTTNNRMELMAAIAGLETLKEPCRVTLHTDSRYLVDAMRLGWARGWRANDWERKSGPALNPDLWERLLQLAEIHTIAFVWVKGHAGNPDNERCDELAKEAALQESLPSDVVYETACLK
ncbi:MAG: ribonuclease HI [Anaerolineae bacterium]|nr:ribonuclease HI [Anaerolineae bacterium]